MSWWWWASNVNPNLFTSYPSISFIHLFPSLPLHTHTTINPSIYRGNLLVWRSWLVCLVYSCPALTMTSQPWQTWRQEMSQPGSGCPTKKLDDSAGYRLVDFVFLCLCDFYLPTSLTQINTIYWLFSVCMRVFNTQELFLLWMHFDFSACG